MNVATLVWIEGRAPSQVSPPYERSPSKYITRIRESVDVLTISGPPSSPLQASFPKIETSKRVLN